MGVQKHLFVIERSVIKELLKLKTNAHLFPKLFFYCKLRRNDHVRHVGKSPGMLSSLFEGVFIECKNSSRAIVNRE